MFKLVSECKPTGDQPKAIDYIVDHAEGLNIDTENVVIAGEVLNLEEKNDEIKSSDEKQETELEEDNT